MRLRQALILVLSILPFAACDSEEPTPEPVVLCRTSPNSEYASTCPSRDLSANAVPAIVFHEHAQYASSAAGVAARYVSGWVDYFASCVAEGMSSALGGKTSICADNYQEDGSSKFEDSTYVLEGSQAVGLSKDSRVEVSKIRTELRFFAAKDLPGVTRGMLVPHDLRRADTFLIGARARLVGGVVTIEYERPGPLVELLGQGASPPNPLSVTEQTYAALRSGLEIEGSIHTKLSDCNFDTVIDQRIDRVPLSAEIRPRLLQGTMRALDETEPRVVVGEWDLHYAPELERTLVGPMPAVLPKGRIVLELRRAEPLRRATISLDDKTASLDLACD